MHATSIPHYQSYYTQPNYTFYYTSSSRYCAYDPVSGDHFIHSLNDNKWYPYFPTQELPTRHKSHDHHSPHAYMYETFEVRESGYRDAGEGGRYSRGRDRSGKENLLYTTAAAESARRSLLEEDIGMDFVYEEELMHGDDWWNSKSPGGGKHHGKKLRGHTYEEHSYGHHNPPHASPRHHRPAKPYQNTRLHEDHTYPETYPHTHHHQQQPHHYHDSNKAHVGSPGSDHDSGYFEYIEEYERTPSPRKAMPGIAKWLDNIEDEGIDFEEPDFDMGTRGGRHDSHYQDGYSQQHPDRRNRTYEDHHNRQPQWEDSGPDMYNINIEINMDVDQGYETHNSYPTSKRNVHHHHNVHENINHKYQEDYDCYYAVPPPPPPPAASARSPTYSRRASHFPNNPTTCYQPNSIYSGPETVRYSTPRQSPPRAPSPPLSPLPYQRRHSTADRVRYVKPEPRLRGRRTW